VLDRMARGMTRVMLRLLLVSALVLVLLAIALVTLAVDNVAAVDRLASPTPAHVERARWLLARHDPRAMRAGVRRTVVLSQEDLDLAINYLANQYLGGASQIVLQQGRAAVRASIVLPANPLGRFVNLEAKLRETDTLPRFTQLRVGRVRVPAFVCNWLLDIALHRLQASARFSATADVIKQVHAGNGFLTVQFEWSDAVPDQLKAALVGPQEQARWGIYQQRLVALTGQSGALRVMRLDQLLGPLMQLVVERSAGGDPAAESRAALTVLAFYVNGNGLSALVPSARDWPTAQRHLVTMAGRTDTPQHFTISAVLSATAGSPLADAVGLYKELDDARVGSGFSFHDLAADRAGTRFGALSVADAAAFSRVRQVVMNGLRESDLIPDLQDLPEFMPQAVFQRRFGGVGQPRYQAMVAQIEQRIAALALYR
jgi:hypothetical protein